MVTDGERAVLDASNRERRPALLLVAWTVRGPARKPLCGEGHFWGPSD
jgi:hypothetical protein